MADIIPPFLAIVSLLLLWKVFCFYLQLSRLPPGPFPLPVIGNFLHLRQQKHHHEMIHDLAQEYGPTFTLFLGSEASIMLTDPQLVRHSLKDSSLAGRPSTVWLENIMSPGSTDMALSDYSRDWEVVRRVGHMAIRKASSSAALTNSVIQVVDQVVDKVANSPFSSSEYMDALITAVISRWCFGKDYEIFDAVLLNVRAAADFVQENMAVRVISFAPILKYLYWNSWQQFLQKAAFLKAYVDENFETLRRTHRSGEYGNFCHTLLSIRGESDSKSQAHLSDTNLKNAVFNNFVAGPDTLIASLRWCLLLMAKNLPMQQRMRQEWDSVIGIERAPVIDDMKQCNFIMAFIMEVLRFRPMSPMTDPHKAVQDTVVGATKIGKGTIVMMSLYSLTRDPKIFERPEEFIPERFLIDGKFQSNANQMFPFSGGRRSCPGDRFAINVLFLVICRLLQKTTNIRAIDADSISLTGDVSIVDKWAPHEHLLCFN